MKKKLQCLFTAIVIAIGVSKGQNIPVLGSNASGFTLFASVGALTNVGDSKVTGDVGTNNAGAYSGFGPTVLTGTAHIADATSIAAQNEINTAYNDFATNNVCGTTLSVTLTGPQTLNAGSYCTGAATTISGDITLDAQLNPNAVFVFQIGGALSLSTSARILLANGAKLQNVYFQVSGAVDLADQSVFRGTLIASGAIELLGTSSLYGKAFSTAGAVSLHSNLVSSLNSPLPVTLTSFTVKKGEGQTALLAWSTTQETNSDRFEIENSSNGKSWQKIGVVRAGGESNLRLSYFYSTEAVLGGVNLYRLKMIDRDESFAYSRIQSLEFTRANQATIYPNPGVDLVTLDVERIELVRQIQFVDIQGKVIFDKSRTSSINISNKIDISNFPAGLYSVRVTSLTGDVSYFKIIKSF
jgi:hypothetical protein